MANNSYSPPSPLVATLEETYKNGKIYLVDNRGSWGDSGTVVDLLKNDKLPKARLVLLPIHEKLRPPSLRDLYAKYRKPSLIPFLPAVPEFRDGSDNLYAQGSQTAPGNLSALPAEATRAAQGYLDVHIEHGLQGVVQRSHTAPDAVQNPLPIPNLPVCYARVLQKICPRCVLQGNILWRNVQQVESRYESRFRSWKKKDGDRVCFLQFHTMQAPVLADLEVTLALVHHLYVSKDSTDLGFDKQHEQIFAFLYIKDDTEETDNNEDGKTKNKEGKAGKKFKSETKKDQTIKAKDEGKKAGDKTTEIIEEHLTRIIKFYQEEHPESIGGIAPVGEAAITPMLFIAALLKWYGFKAAEKVVGGFDSLIKIDDILRAEDENLLQGSPKEKAKKCDDVNQKLIRLNQSLTGLRSRVNYVAESAQDMIRDSCTMKEFVAAELRWGNDDFIRARECLEKALDLLDSTKFAKRDNEKFNLIKRAMKQYQVDVKSLKSHLAINIGLVSNLYAHLLAEAAAQDTSKVLIGMIASTVLLPMTFASILLTGPMFHFDAKNNEPLLRSLPWRIFWGISGGLIGLIILFFCIPYGVYSSRQYKKKMEEKRIEKKEKETEREDKRREEKKRENNMCWIA